MNFSGPALAWAIEHREELNCRGAAATTTLTITSAANGIPKVFFEKKNNWTAIQFDEFSKHYYAYFLGRPTVAQKSSLEMKLHKLRFIELLRNEQNKMDAIKYARTYFPQFVNGHEREIQALMGALMFAGTTSGSWFEFGLRIKRIQNGKKIMSFHLNLF